MSLTSIHPSSVRTSNKDRIACPVWSNLKSRRCPYLQNEVKVKNLGWQETEDRGCEGRGKDRREKEERRERRERERGKTNSPNPWHEDCGSRNVASLQQLSPGRVQTNLKLSHALTPIHTNVIAEPQWTVLGSVRREQLQRRE